MEADDIEAIEEFAWEQMIEAKANWARNYEQYWTKKGWGKFNKKYEWARKFWLVSYSQRAIHDN